jgi:hypothetical protein
MAALRACALQIILENCNFQTHAVEEKYFRILTNAGIMTPNDIKGCSEEQWVAFRNCGIKPFHIIKIKRQVF